MDNCEGREIKKLILIIKEISKNISKIYSLKSSFILIIGPMVCPRAK